MRPPRKEDYSPSDELILQGFTIGKVSSVLGFVRCLDSSNVGSRGQVFIFVNLLYRSESCRRRLRRTAPDGPPGLAIQARPAYR